MIVRTLKVQVLVCLQDSRGVPETSRCGGSCVSVLGDAEDTGAWTLT